MPNPDGCQAGFCWRGPVVGPKQAALADDWTEERIRKEAAWDAFRDGKRLLESGAVGDRRSKPGLETAVFRIGGKQARTVVKFGDGIEVTCACRDNRATGSFCAHGVAVMLARLQEPRMETERKPAASIPTRAAKIVFLPGYDRALSKGRLAVGFEWLDQDADAADERLWRWMAKEGLAESPPPRIQLDPERLGSFLGALRGHPRVADANGGVLEVDVMEPLPVVSSAIENGALAIQLNIEGISPIAAQGGVGWLRGRSLGLAPATDMTADCEQRVLDALTTGRARIPAADLSTELQTWLDLTREPRPGWLGQVRFENVAPLVRITLEGSLNALDATVRVEDPGMPPLDETHPVVTVEDPTSRAGLLSALRDASFNDRGGDLWVMRDHDGIVGFLANRLPDWKQRWNVSIGPKLEHVMRSMHVVRPVVTVPEAGSLSVEISYQTGGGKVIPRAKVLDMIRSGRRSVRTSSGAEVVLSSELVDEFEPLVSDLGLGRAEGRVSLGEANFACLREWVGEPDPPSLDEAPATLNGISLRPYQRFGVAWLLNALGRLKGALLADEMGLGKTLQSIAVIESLIKTQEIARTLLVVPSSLLANWESEFRKFAPELRVVRLHGTGRDALRDQPADVVLTSYGTLARDLAFHLREGCDLLVLDEAGAIRNPASQISKAIAKLPAQRRIALSGTPVENRLLDLWSVFRVVAPGHLGPKDDFTQRYAAGDPDASRRLGDRVAPFVLRRTKSEVARDLPPKIETDVLLELDERGRSLYREIATAGLAACEEIGDPGAARMHLLTVLLRLRQVCLAPELVDPEENGGVKSEWLEGLLEERFEENRKTLVFSQFAGFLRNTEERFESRFGRVFRLDGSTRDRGRLVDAFQNHSGPAVFLISLKAGGYGLNLTAADTVVHMDPWWNPAAEAQASDRAHRIGQRLPVSVYRLLVRDSVEERVRQLQESKRALIEGVNGGDSGQGWSAEEMMRLLQ